MDIKNIVDDVDDNLKSFKSAYQNLLKMRDEIKDNIATLEKSLAEVEDTLGFAPATVKPKAEDAFTGIKKSTPSGDYPPLMNDESLKEDNDSDASTEVEELNDGEGVATVAATVEANDDKSSPRKTASRKTAVAKKSPVEEVEDSSDEEDVDVKADSSKVEKVDKINSKDKVQQIINDVEDDDELLLDDDDDDAVADDIDELPF